MAEMNPLRRLRAVPGGGRPVGDAPLDPTDEAARALLGAGRGDEAAFGRFYDLTSRAVHGVVLRVVRDPSMAEEITQEVYLELWRLAPRYDRSRGGATAWATTVAHRRAVDRVRSEQSRRHREQREGRRAEVPFDRVTEEVTDRLDRARVRVALDSLSQAQRDAVTLAYYGGNTYREVAVLLDLPEGTVKTRIRDGLIKLRDQFEVTP
jgi:RNA polymerase sigma-70 factor (ECF subfamily)